jgi:hypothetical protein
MRDDQRNARHEHRERDGLLGVKHLVPDHRDRDAQTAEHDHHRREHEIVAHGLAVVLVE